METKTTRFRLLSLVVSGCIAALGVGLGSVAVSEETTTIMATASSGTGDYAPELAVDGKMSTRWSSGFGDAEWWQIRFETPRRLCGLKISWETAFAEKYEVAVSMDGNEWRTVYAVDEGDGQTDLIFFKPVEAQYLRIVCKQRGTGWGHSIWEVKLYEAAQAPKVTASSFREAGSPELALDGDPATAWHSGEDKEPSITIQLPESMSLGGLELYWGKHFAKVYRVETSPDGKEWKQVAEEHKGNGGKDYVFFPATEAHYVRITALKSAEGKGVELALVEFKTGEEQATPIRDYQAKARDSRPGLFPMWLTRQQEFWTVVGVPDDPQESLLGETGTFEPFKEAFSVQPFIMMGDHLFSWADVKLEQRLEEDYLPLPSVRWLGPGWKLDISAVAWGDPGKTWSAVRYRLSSETNFDGQLALAIRPVQLNPIWQYGGMSPIRTIECVMGDTVRIVMNNRDAVVLPMPPAVMGTAPLRDGDTADYLLRNEFPLELKASDPDGKCGGGVLYNMKASSGQSTEVVILYPLHSPSEWPSEFVSDPAAAFEKVRQSERARWEPLLNRIGFDIPEERLIKVMKSNLAYVLINRDAPWFKPGARNYNHSWMRDGALTGVAMLRMGLPELPGEFIRAFNSYIRPNGWVPYMILEDGKPIGSSPDAIGGEGQEYDSQGEYPFIVRQYVDYTGDTNLLAQVYPQVIQSLKFAMQLRRFRMTREYQENPDRRAYYGLLPESNSHEGYYPAKHSYWDDFWVLRGLQDGAALAERMGKTNDVAWMRAEEAAFRKDLYASILEVIRRNSMNVIPGCVELGDIDPTSTTIAIMAADEKDELPQPYANNTFDLYYKNFARRLSPEFVDTFTPYEVRNADVFVRLGQRERALTMLRYLTEQSTRPHHWNHFAEVVHAKPRAPSYIGDMPHTWVGSDLINAMRSIFAYEHKNRLVLAAGIDPAWLQDGVAISKLPTPYGVVSYQFRKEIIPFEKPETHPFFFAAEGNAAPPAGFELPLPSEWPIERIELNGRPVQPVTQVLRFQTLPVEIRIFLQTDEVNAPVTW
jgi:hypothetical protein